MNRTSESVMAELADLRAYKARTEAALVDLCRRAGESPTDYEYVCPDDLRDLGLWREDEGGRK